MRSVPAEDLFDDPRTWDLFGEYGVVILPDEEAGWQERLEKKNLVRAWLDRVRDQPGYFAAEFESASSSYTVWMTAAAADGPLESLSPVAASVRTINVANDRASMEMLRSRLLAGLSSEQNDALLEVDLKPDQLAVTFDDGAPNREALRRAIETGGAADEVGRAGVSIEVSFVDRPATPSGLCSSRRQCAPAGGGFEIGACSSSAPVVSSSGQRALASAGHCYDESAEESDASIRSNRNDNANVPSGIPVIVFDVLATRFENNAPYDFAALYESIESQFVQNSYYRDPASRLNEIRSAGSASVGDRVCSSGRNNNSRVCGTVTDNDATRTLDNEETTLTNLLVVDYDSSIFTAPGDSGSIVTDEDDDTRIVGMFTGGTLEDGGEPDERFSEGLLTQDLPPGWSYFLGDAVEFNGPKCETRLSPFMTPAFYEHPTLLGSRIGRAGLGMRTTVCPSCESRTATS